MSRKSLTFLLLTAASIGTGSAHAAPPRVPLGNAIIKTDENAAKNPQAPGPRNANEKQRANQARFVDKHFGPDAPQRVLERAHRGNASHTRSGGPGRPGRSNGHILSSNR